jgi:arylsulfatase A-like enzyme
MDQLAKDGMAFMDAHTSSAVCSPSRYSVLTGRYNWRSRLKRGVLNGLSPSMIEPGRETVASFLKANGYKTACFGKWHMGMGIPTRDGNPPKSTATKPSEIASRCNVDWGGKIKDGPTAVGFDIYWGIVASLDMPPYIWIDNDRFSGECTTIKAFHRPGPAEAGFEAEDVLPTLVEKTVRYIEKQATSKTPFFIYMPLNSPHTPIVPSKTFQGKSSIGAYGDFVMETDWAIGEVVKAVEASGMAKNTLIVVTADNGCSPAAARTNPKRFKFNSSLSEATDTTLHYPSIGYRGHKADIYEGGHRVPFVVRWDGKVKSGSTCSDTVSLVDFFATCADIIDQPVPETAAEDSVSLLPDLLGQAKQPLREALVHHSINGSFAIRQGKWKLAFCPGSGGWSNPKPPKRNADPATVAQLGKQGWVQLFDIESDPAEQHNVAKQHPETVEQLTQLAQRYIDQGRSTPGAPQQNTGEVTLYPRWIQAAQRRSVQ